MRGRNLAGLGLMLVLALLVSGCSSPLGPTTEYFSFSVSITMQSNSAFYILIPFKTTTDSGNITKYFEVKGDITAWHTSNYGKLCLNISGRGTASISVGKSFTQYAEETAFKSKIFNPDYSYVPQGESNKTAGSGRLALYMYSEFGGSAPSIYLRASNAGDGDWPYLRCQLESGWCRYQLRDSRPME